MPRLSERDQRRVTVQLLAGAAVLAAVVVVLVLVPQWMSAVRQWQEPDPAAWPQVCRVVHPEDLDRFGG